MDQFDTLKPKPAAESLGMIANSGGVVINTLALITALGVSIPEPYTMAVFAAGSLAASIAGLLGRARAKQRIEGIFSKGD